MTDNVDQISNSDFGSLAGEKLCSNADRETAIEAKVPGGTRRLRVEHVL